MCKKLWTSNSITKLEGRKLQLCVLTFLLATWRLSAPHLRHNKVHFYYPTKHSTVSCSSVNTADQYAPMWLDVVLLHRVTLTENASISLVSFIDFSKIFIICAKIAQNTQLQSIRYKGGGRWAEKCGFYKIWKGWHSQIKWSQTGNHCLAKMYFRAIWSVLPS